MGTQQAAAAGGRRQGHPQTARMVCRLVVQGASTGNTEHWEASNESAEAQEG